MSQVSAVLASVRNYHQGNGMIPTVDERRQSSDQQQQHQRDKRFRLPDDEEIMHIDEYA